MQLWVYLLGNIITGLTILLSAAFGVGKLTQVLASHSEQLVRLQADIESHQNAFDAVHRSLLELAMRLGDHS